jgi:hypothetical protein
MKKIIKIWAIVFITGLFFLACEKRHYLGGSPCEYCYQTQPDTGDLIINLTIDKRNSEVEISVYKGKLDQNNLDTVFYGLDDTVYIGMKVDQYYTVTARYKTSDGKTVIAVDGAELTTTRDYISCDQVCYWAEEFYDVRLRY